MGWHGTLGLQVDDGERPRFIGDVVKADSMYPHVKRVLTGSDGTHAGKAKRAVCRK